MTIHVYNGDKTINANIIGSPIINNEVVSSFSTSNYLLTDYINFKSANSWEIVIKAKHDVDNRNCGFVATKTRYSGINCYHNEANVLALELSSNGTGFDIGALVGTTQIPNQTWFYAKYEFTGSAYNFYYSTNSVNWILQGSINSTVHVNANSQFVLGNDDQIGGAVAGLFIDVSQSYIKLNGVQAWKGMKSVYKKIGSVWYGNQEITEIYNGNDLVFSAFKPQTFTFNASTSLQTFVVPKNCTHLDVDCVASKGWNGGNTAGKGGRVQCRLSVTAGQTLYIYAGTIPTSGSRAYNASDIRTNNAGVTDTTSLQSRLIVAGGGGSSANSGLNTPGAGGQGGGLTGGNGGNGSVCTGAGGGTQTAGGARGGSSAAYPSYGSAGEFGLGGNGYSGGAGGAGYYGGGGGSGGGAVYSYVCSGGGGGSSYTNPNRCTNVTHTQGYRDDAGYVTITTIN